MNIGWSYWLATLSISYKKFKYVFFRKSFILKEISKFGKSRSITSIKHLHCKPNNYIICQTVVVNPKL